MVKFKDLKVATLRCCKTKQSADISDRFSFEIDFAKLEKALKELDSNLHVLSFAEKKESHIPSLEDVQLLVEYLHKPREIETVFDGQTQICTFMIYYTAQHESNDTYREFESFADAETNTPYTQEDLFKFCNVAIDFSLIHEIIEKVPMYQVLVYKTFNNRKDKFDYQVNFRSNYEMVGYHKFVESKELDEEEAEIEKNIPTATTN
jgi:hypothetical protein